MIATRPETAVPLALVAVSAGALGSAFIAQYGFGLEPCDLCIYQRIPFAVTGLLGMAALAATRSRAVLVGLVALAAAAFLINSGIAFYHVGVERHWWASTCSGGAEGPMTTADLMAALQKPARRSCDEVNWTIMGISVASWNVLFSGGLAVMAGVAARYLRRRNGF